MYDSIYMKCPEQANPQREKAGVWLVKVEGMRIGGNGGELLKVRGFF